MANQAIDASNKVAKLERRVEKTDGEKKHALALIGELTGAGELSNISEAADVVEAVKHSKPRERIGRTVAKNVGGAAGGALYGMGGVARVVSIAAAAVGALCDMLGFGDGPGFGRRSADALGGMAPGVLGAKAAAITGGAAAKRQTKAQDGEGL